MKLKAPVKGIFFDAGWTLFYPIGNDWFFPKEFIDPKLLNAIPEDRKNKTIQAALKYLDDNHLVFTIEEEIKQFKYFYSMISSALPELKITGEKIDALVHRQVSGETICFFEDTLPTIKALQGKYRMGIISDNWPSLETRLIAGGLDSCFSTMTISSYLGFCKPDERMYRHALEQMNLPPEETVFIDDYEDNLEAALGLGIQPVLITARPDTLNTGAFISISRLSELPGILPR